MKPLGLQKETPRGCKEAAHEAQASHGVGHFLEVSSFSGCFQIRLLGLASPVEGS